MERPGAAKGPATAGIPAEERNAGGWKPLLRRLAGSVAGGWNPGSRVATGTLVPGALIHHLTTFAPLALTTAAFTRSASSSSFMIGFASFLPFSLALFSFAAL